MLMNIGMVELKHATTLEESGERNAIYRSKDRTWIRL